MTFQSFIEDILQKPARHDMNIFAQQRYQAIANGYHQQFIDIIIKAYQHKELRTEPLIYELITHRRYDVIKREDPNLVLNRINHLFHNKADAGSWYPLAILCQMLNRNSPYIWHNYGLVVFFIMCYSLIKFSALPEHQESIKSLKKHKIYKKIIKRIETKYWQEDDLEDSYNDLLKIAIDHDYWQDPLAEYDDPWYQLMAHGLYMPKYNDLYNKVNNFLKKQNIDIKEYLVLFTRHYSNLGDNFMCISLMASWTQHYDIPIILFIHPNQDRWLSDMFGYYMSKVFTMGQNDIPILEDTPIPMEILPMKKNILSCWSTKRFAPARFYPIVGRHYPDSMRVANGCLNIDSAPAYKPKHNIKKVKDTFNNANFKAEKTVLIAPFSVTNNRSDLCNHMLMPYWQKLIQELKNNDFYPLINIGKNEEKHPLDAEHIHIPLEDFINFIEIAGFFVTTRAGIGDIAYHSDAICLTVNHFNLTNQHISLKPETNFMDTITVINGHEDYSVMETIGYLKNKKQMNILMKHAKSRHSS